MNEGQGLLSQVLGHWESQGWDPDILHSYRMEMNNPGGESGGTAGNEGGTSQGGGQEQSGYSQEFGNPFLSKVSPEHRPIVEPYLKDWDGNVTKKFQELHAKYQPYEQLGDIESLQQAAYIAQLFESPDGLQQIYNFVAQELGIPEGNAQGPGHQQELEVPEEFEGLPPAFLEKWNQQQQALEAMAQIILESQQSSQEQAEDAELDELLEYLHETHGEFDEDFVLSKMYAGMDPEKAVQAFQELVQNSINGRTGPVGQKVPVLGGGGVTPLGENKSVKDLSRNETRDLVAQFLAAANQS